MKTSIINGSEVSKLSVAIQFTITSVACTASEPLRAFLTGNRKTGNKPPENPPETRRLCFYGMHEYAPSA
jgi:hypothetical protein